MDLPRVILAALVLGMASRGTAAEVAGVPDVLSLPSAKRIALAGNPGVAALLARVSAAEAVVSQARSALAPQVDASAAATWLRDVSLAGGNDNDTPAFQLGVSAQWLAFDGFARRFRIRAAEAGSEISLAAWRDGQRLLAHGVASAFLACLLAEDAAHVLERDAEFNRALLEEARRKQAVGTAARADVLNFSVRTREAENTLLGSRREQRAARQVLAALLGIAGGDLPQSTRLEVPDPVAADSLPDVAAAIELALDQRPDLQAQQHTLAQLEALVRVAEAQFAPQLVTQASTSLARVDDLDFRGDHDADSAVGIALSWRLFDGGLRRHQVAEAKALLQAATAARNQLRLDIPAEVRRAVDAVQTTAQQYANQEEITGMSREIRDIVRQEYLAGVAALTRLNEAQTDLVRAEGRLSQIRSVRDQAVENLHAALGTHLPGEP